MDEKPQFNEQRVSFTSLHAVIVFLICSVTAELILQNFLEPSQTTGSAALSRVLVVFLSLYITHRFALLSRYSYRPSVKDLALFAIIIIGCISTIWLGRIVAIGLSAYAEKVHFAPLAGDSPTTLLYAIPFAVGGLLLKAFLGLSYGFVFGVCVSVIVAIYIPSQILLVPYVLTTTFVACLSLSRFRTRSAYLRAGLNVALISIPFAFASVLIEGTIDPATLAIRIIAALFGGILCIFIAGGVTPVIEHLGGYVTDMRLIEMATLDHPLLKELSVQAPGTWNHSMVMGMMCEAAADATGANPVLARVGAYFHDIGKMKKPLYFVENQLPGENRHDKLSSSMSALIIRSHVKDGIELARKHKLPQIIEDMIPQHHGTSRIEYFYDKARTEAEESGEDIEVDESLYTYPGPRPQTREAGILMLADGIEAAARTLSEPTLDRIQGMVQKMINKVFASGELNECELTLKDLHLIAKCFTRVLNGIYHQRIAYAEPAEKTSEKAEEEESAESVASGDPRKKQKSETPDEDDKEDDKEDLKRLGIS